MLNFVNNFIENVKNYNTITIENGVVLKLNKWNHTAMITKSPNANGDIFIPRSISYESQNYIITGICDFEYKNDIKSIRFSEDSAIKVFDKTFMHNCSLLLSNIPPSVEKIEFDVEYLTYNFKKFDFYSSNANFSFLDEDKKLIASRYAQNHTGLLCYSLSQNNEFNGPFDNLLLAKNDIKSAIIPSSIKNIDYYCFSNCNQIKKIEFEPNSSLETICANAFFYSTIEEIELPSKVYRLMDCWCASTRNLKRLSVSHENNFLRMIDNKILVGKKNVDDQVFNTLLFANRNIKSVVIPASIEIISMKSFQLCRNLRKVEFEKNSKLKEIQLNAFESSDLRYFEIPENLILIDEKAFEFCGNVEKLSFSMNSKLSSLPDHFLEKSKINHLIIPSSIKKIGKDAFYLAKLESVEILSDNLECGSDCFGSNRLKLISFPNAKKVTFEDFWNKENLYIYIRAKGVIKFKFN